MGVTRAASKNEDKEKVGCTVGVIRFPTLIKVRQRFNESVERIRLDVPIQSANHIATIG